MLLRCAGAQAGRTSCAASALLVGSCSMRARAPQPGRRAWPQEQQLQPSRGGAARAPVQRGAWAWAHRVAAGLCPSLSPGSTSPHTWSANASRHARTHTQNWRDQARCAAEDLWRWTLVLCLLTRLPCCADACSAHGLPCTHVCAHVRMHKCEHIHSMHEYTRRRLQTQAQHRLGCEGLHTQALLHTFV